ncbi:MAG TPA: 50S ribosomal protein L18 [Alphaproteobacteria bacterium]|jgi:large subunit ribosomal protein L18|nr:50S ribosomal protein L18 [Alphaproteobacteria bacterium]
MKKLEIKAKRYSQRKRRVKAKISGTADRPRLTVFKSNQYVYAQIIDDEKGHTLVSAKGVKVDGEKVGEDLAKKAVAKKIKKVVFDRNGFMYHGRIKAIADGARKGGLEF